MNELALFAGAGGGILGGILCGFRTVCAVEKEPYCREVLLRRQRDGVLPLFPIWDDVRTFDGTPWRGLVDVVTAGFPCQPWSTAGQRRGTEDERNLWPDTVRILREVGPRFAFLENVPNLLAHDYFGTILGTLGEAGFDAEWGVVSAAEVGAPHLRERLWIVAIQSGVPDVSGHGVRLEREREREQHELARTAESSDDGAERPYPNINSERGSEGFEEATLRRRDTVNRRGGWWNVEPGVGRVVHGLANRIHRIAAIGNGQVPRVAEEAWQRLTRRAPCATTTR